MTDDRLCSILREIFEGQFWPRPFNLLQAAERVRAGEDPKLVAKAARTTVSRLVGFTTALDSIQAVFGLSFANLQQEDFDGARRILGQLVFGIGGGTSSPLERRTSFFESFSSSESMRSVFGDSQEPSEQRSWICTSRCRRILSSCDSSWRHYAARD
jgi:hypothetical protein